MSRCWTALATAVVVLSAVRVLVPSLQMHGLHGGEWWYIQSIRTHDQLDGPGDMSNFNIQFQPDALLLRGQCAVWAAPLEMAWWGPHDMSVGTFVEREHVSDCDPAEQAAANRWFDLLRTMTGWKIHNDEAMRLRGIGCMTEQGRERGQCEIVGLLR